MGVHEVTEPFTPSRVDEGEGSCAVLANTEGATFLLTDDLRALPELRSLTDAKVALSPIVLRAPVKRGVVKCEEARHDLERLAEARDWLGAPIYRRATELFEE
jgi:predicted nucleic acid-binding protein